MKRTLFFIIGLLFLITLSYASYKKYNSSAIQAILLYDFNNGTRYFKLEENIDKLDDDFPNITATALPIKYLIARYYLELDSVTKAKDLLYKSIKDNPFIFAPEALLATFYFDEKQIDSAFFYSKNAFFGLSNNNRHRDIYFKVLKEMKDTLSLDFAFNKIRDYKNAAHWYDYVLTRNDINNEPDIRLLNLIDEIRLRFPEEDTMKVNSIKRFIELDDNRYTLALINSEKANEEFRKENFLGAVKFYEMAIDLDDQQYLFFENAAITYDNLKDYSKAEEYFNKVIYEFKTADGRSEFSKGLMLLKNQNILGCQYLQIAAKKNYIGSSTGIKALDVYRQLCQN